MHLVMLLILANCSGAPRHRPPPDERWAASIAAAARRGQEQRLSMALADDGKAMARRRRDCFVAVVTHVLGAPTRRDAELIWHAKRDVVLDVTQMAWGEIVSV